MVGVVAHRTDGRDAAFERFAVEKLIPLPLLHRLFAGDLFPELGEFCLAVRIRRSLDGRAQRLFDLFFGEQLQPLHDNVGYTLRFAVVDISIGQRGQQLQTARLPGIGRSVAAQQFITVFQSPDDGLREDLLVAEASDEFEALHTGRRQRRLFHELQQFARRDRTGVGQHAQREALHVGPRACEQAAPVGGVSLAGCHVGGQRIRLDGLEPEGRVADDVSFERCDQPVILPDTHAV